MKVKCVKTSLDNPSKAIINDDMKEYLVIGTLFWVFGLTFSKNATYVYIFNGIHLFEAPIGLFEVVDNKVSNEWKVKVWQNEEITLWPDLFYQDGFIENFAERESHERLLFEGLRLKIEQ